MVSAGNVLHVGDVAGVADVLGTLTPTWSAWSCDSIQLPETAAGASALMHAAALPLRALRTPVAVSRALRRSDFDVMHLHWARSAPFMPRRRPPLVVHAHGSDVRGRRDQGMHRLVMRAMEQADAVLVSTPDLLEFTPASAMWLPNPVDTDFYCPADESQVISAGRESEVLIHARISEIKGADVLIAAAIELRRRAPDVVIRAFSGGTRDGDAARAGILLERPVGRAGILSALQRAAVVIGQQRLGMIGLSELEAMATARPVVMPVDRAQYPDVPTVDATDAEDLARCVADLLDNPVDRTAVGASGRAYVERFHSPEVVVRNLVSVYESVVRR